MPWATPRLSRYPSLLRASRALGGGRPGLVHGTERRSFGADPVVGPHSWNPPRGSGVLGEVACLGGMVCRGGLPPRVASSSVSRWLSCAPLCSGGAGPPLLRLHFRITAGTPSSRAALRLGVPQRSRHIRKMALRRGGACGGPVGPCGLPRAGVAFVCRCGASATAERTPLGLPRERPSGLECQGGGTAFGGSGAPGWGAAEPVGPSGVALPLHSGLRALRCLRPMRPSVPPWEFLTRGLLAWSATEEAPRSEEAARRGGASAGP